MGNGLSFQLPLNFSFPNLTRCFCCISHVETDDDDHEQVHGPKETDVMDTLQRQLEIIVATNTILDKKGLVSLVLLKIMTTMGAESGEVSVIKRKDHAIYTIASIGKTTVSEFVSFPLKHLTEEVGTLSLNVGVKVPDDFTQHLNILEDLLDTIA